MPNTRICLKHDQEPVPKTRNVAYNNAQLRLPTKELCLRLAHRGFATTKVKGTRTVRPTANLKLASLECAAIVKHYNSIIAGLVNYYSFINQRSDL